MSSGGRIRVLLAASEAYPLIKTGGLADVVGALPLALRRLGVDARLLLPAYPAARAALSPLRPLVTTALHGAQFTLLRADLPGQGRELLPVYLLESSAFSRPGDPYRDDSGRDWPDNPARFTLFCRAAAALALGRLVSWQADVVHAHDWQTGLLPALLNVETKRPGSVFTIHNLAYQGLIEPGAAAALMLPEAWMSADKLEFYGRLSMIKGGLVFADRLTTVSPRYAEEIKTEAFGCGLDGLLRHRSGVLSGILNGIDTEIWNPAKDKALAATFDATSLPARAINKAALQSEFGLRVTPEPLLLGLVGRLVEQKGVDLLLAALDLLPADVQIAVLGSGDASHVAALQAAAAAAPGRVAFRAGYDEALAHLIQGGVDAFLVPSRFEPCGLTQLYALRYGAVPIVRAVGGLADTVVDASPANLAAGRATGIVFDEASGAALAAAVLRALGLYRAAEPWRQMQLTGMAADHGWETSAAAYRDLYHEVRPTSRP